MRVFVTRQVPCDGAWRRLHTRAEEGRLLIVYQLLVSFTSPRGLLLSVPLPDRVWTSRLGRRLRRGMLRRLSTVTTRSMQPDFEASCSSFVRGLIRRRYIVICYKTAATGRSFRCALSSCKKTACAAPRAAVNTASFCGSYSKAAAFLGSGHEFRSAAASLQITRRS